MNSIDTYLYDRSIPLISALQHGQLSGHADLMQLISTVFDPKYAFLIYSPIVFLLDQQIGKRLILTTVIAEWLNQVLKWLLHGERPYWYVHSSGHFDAKQVPIEQFPITCELGPGHPSGHAMVTAALWYIILHSALELYWKFQSNSSEPKQPGVSGKGTIAQSKLTSLPNMSIWSLYLLILITVSVSRVFLGCHFPHQCLAGALLGFLLAKWASKINVNGWHFTGVSVFLFVSAFATYGLLQVLGFNPSWTINLATKHCIKRDYIHLDTAPLFSIMRYCGFALGTGLGLLIPLKSYAQQVLSSDPLVSTTPEGKLFQTKSSPSNPYIFSIRILMALLMARLIDNLGLFVSHANLPLFYSSAFLGYTGFSFALINL